MPDKKSLNILSKLSAAFFAQNIMSSFMEHLDDVLVGRVKSTQRELMEITETFTNLSSKFEDLASRLQESSSIASENVEKISSLNAELQTELQKAGTDMASVGEDVEKTVSDTFKILESFKQVEDMINDISKIAKQTNLLALNASIEAARAGEFGRGFSVIASEIQKLATHSKEVSENISEQVRTISSAIEDAINNIKKVKEMFDILSQSMTKFLDFLLMNKEFLEQVKDMMESAYTDVSQGSTDMKKSVEIMKEAISRFDTVTNVISSIINAQVNLKNLEI